MNNKQQLKEAMKLAYEAEDLKNKHYKKIDILLGTDHWVVCSNCGIPTPVGSNESYRVVCSDCLPPGQIADFEPIEKKTTCNFYIYGYYEDEGDKGWENLGKLKIKNNPAEDAMQAFKEEVKQYNKDKYFYTLYTKYILVESTSIINTSHSVLLHRPSRKQ